MKICWRAPARWARRTRRRCGKIGGVEIVSVASRTEEGGARFAAECGIPFHSTSLEACLDRPGVEAVILTTPSAQHCEQTLLALGRGAHVQVEIPMSLNLPDAEKMVAAARRAGRVCMVTHTRRFSARTARSAGASRRARSTSITWWSRRTSSAAPT